MRRPLIFIIATMSIASSWCPGQQSSSKQGTNEAAEAQKRGAKYVAIAEKRCQEAEDAVASLNARLRDETGLSNVDAGLRTLISSLQEQRETIQIEEAAATGRRQGIEDAITKFSDQVKKRVASDEVTSEITKLV